MKQLIGAAAVASLTFCALAWGQIVDVPIGGGGGPGSQVLNAAGTVGDVVVVGPLTQGVQDSSALAASSVTLPKGLNFTGSPAVATSITPNTSEIYWSGTYSGACTSVPGCFANSLLMLSTVDASASSNGLGNLQVQTTLNSASVKGSVANFQSNLTVSLATGNATNKDYVSANLWASGLVNDGGGSGTERGSLFAINPQSVLRTAATFWVENSVDEHDFSIDTSSSAKYGYIYKAVLLSDNATAPTSDSAAYSAGLQAGGIATLSCMLCTGANGSGSPLASTADFIGHHGAGAAPSIANGVNFSTFTFSTAAIKAQDAQNFVIQLGTSVSPRLFVVNSGGNGAALTVSPPAATITSRLDIAPGSGAGGAVTLSQAGSGTGGIILTASTLQIGSASSFTANGASSVTITNVLPNGHTATIAKWLTIKDSGGVTSYIPIWQ